MQHDLKKKPTVYTWSKVMAKLKTNMVSKKKKKRLVLQAQTILQYLYKLLIWQNLSGLHLGLPLTLHFYLPIITNHINSL